MATPDDSYEVVLTAGAEQDLEGIFDYIARVDGLANANHVLDAVMALAESLARLPERGGFPRELAALGIKEYRQCAFKPYRVIYRVIDRRVVIYVIADERRDMQALLARRLLAR